MERSAVVTGKEDEMKTCNHPIYFNQMRAFGESRTWTRSLGSIDDEIQP